MVAWKDTEGTKWKDTEGMKSLQEGDTVMFATGKGPVMRVVKILSAPVDSKDKGTGNVLCKWWDKKENNFKEYYFNTDQLKPYKPGPAVRVRGYRT